MLDCQSFFVSTNIVRLEPALSGRENLELMHPNNKRYYFKIAKMRLHSEFWPNIDEIILNKPLK